MIIQTNETWSVGIELRDHFAGQALTGICSNDYALSRNVAAKFIAAAIRAKAGEVKT